jgi:hypothetical protein
VGAKVGAKVVGAVVGTAVGEDVGAAVVGVADGVPVGEEVGAIVVGAAVGDAVGDPVHVPHMTGHANATDGFAHSVEKSDWHMEKSATSWHSDAPMTALVEQFVQLVQFGQLGIMDAQSLTPGVKQTGVAIVWFAIVVLAAPKSDTRSTTIDPGPAVSEQLTSE